MIIGRRGRFLSTAPPLVDYARPVRHQGVRRRVLVLSRGRLDRARPRPLSDAGRARDVQRSLRRGPLRKRRVAARRLARRPPHPRHRGSRRAAPGSAGRDASPGRASRHAGARAPSAAARRRPGGGARLWLLGGQGRESRRHAAHRAPVRRTLRSGRLPSARLPAVARRSVRVDPPWSTSATGSPDHCPRPAPSWRSCTGALSISAWVCTTRTSAAPTSTSRRKTSCRHTAASPRSPTFELWPKGLSTPSPWPTTTTTERPTAPTRRCCSPAARPAMPMRRAYGTASRWSPKCRTSPAAGSPTRARRGSPVVRPGSAGRARLMPLAARRFGPRPPGPMERRSRAGHGPAGDT